MIPARPFHPLLLAIFPPLFLLSHNATEAGPGELFVPMAAGLLVAALVWGIAWLLLKNPTRGALIATLFLVLFFTFTTRRMLYEQVLDFLSTFWIPRDVHLRPLPVVCTDFVLLGLGAWRVAKLRNDPIHLTRGLNLVTTLLVGFSLVGIAPAVSTAIRSAHRGGISTRRSEAVVPLAPKSAHRPDIYYILLDGFGREDVLKTYYDYDLSPFLARLEKAGFYVAKDARANYAQTPLCLSSSLNSRYLDDPAMGDPASLGDLKELIGRNTVAQSLKPLGYQFVTFATGFEPTDHPEADVYFTPHMHLSEFERMLLSFTPLMTLFAEGRGDSFALMRARTLHVLEKLPTLTANPAPTFAFAHVVCPHPPFVFGEHGEDVSPYGEAFDFQDGNVLNLDAHGPKDFIRKYRKQVVFLVDRVGQMVEEILANSPEPPIILIQSDHGPALHLNIHSRELTDLHERMSILNAYYLPEAGRKLLYPEISPVNSFRVVMNSTFDAHLPLLPDRSYFSIWDTPFQFINVTDALREDALKRGAIPQPANGSEGKGILPRRPGDTAG